jgi:hypothetical protein
MEFLMGNLFDIFDQAIKDKLFTEYAFSYKNNVENISMFSKNSLAQFDIASLSKVYATNILYRIVNIPLQESIPYFSQYTYEDLLNHQTYFLPWAPLFEEENKDIFFLMQKYHTHPKKEYSDLNYIFLWELSKKFCDPQLVLLNFFQKNHLQISFHPSEHFIFATEKNFQEELFLKKKLPLRERNTVNDYNAYKGFFGHAGLFSNVEDLQTLNTIFLQDFLDRPFGFKTNKNFQENTFFLGHDAFTGCYSFFSQKFSFILLTNRLIYNKPDLTNFRKQLFLYFKI